MKLRILITSMILAVLLLSGCAKNADQNLNSSEQASENAVTSDGSEVVNQIIEDAKDGTDTQTTDQTTATEQTAVSDQTDTTGQAGASESSGSTDAAQPNNEDLQRYVDLNLVDKDGNPINLSDYEGKFIALNFFGVWCKYCMEEMPDLQEVYSEYGGDDFVILLVNATTTENIGADGVKEWYEKGGYTMPMMMDLDGTALGIYPVSGFPTTYFINKDGYIIGAIPGKMEKETLLTILETYNK